MPGGDYAGIRFRHAVIARGKQGDGKQTLAEAKAVDAAQMLNFLRLLDADADGAISIDDLQVRWGRVSFMCCWAFVRAKLRRF